MSCFHCTVTSPSACSLLYYILNLILSKACNLGIVKIPREIPSKFVGITHFKQELQELHKNYILLIFYVIIVTLYSDIITNLQKSRKNSTKNSKCH